MQDQPKQRRDESDKGGKEGGGRGKSKISNTVL